MHLEFRISNEDLSNLSRLIGTEVNALHYQKMFEDPNGISANIIYVENSEKTFVRVKTDEWSDTFVEAIDCFRLRAELVPNPFETISNESEKEVLFESAFNPVILVNKIDVFEFNESAESESVSFDIALLLSENEENMVLIGINNFSISGDLYFVSAKEKISEMLANYKYVQTVKHA